MTHVLYVANSSLIGGANRVLMDMIAGVDRSRFSPHLVVPRPGPLATWARDRGLPISVVADGDLLGRAALFRRATQLTAVAVAARARIVHAIDPACYRAAGLAGRLAGAARVCHIEFPTGPQELAWSFQYGPEAIVTCHRQQAEEVAAAIGTTPGSRVVSIPNSVDTIRFQPRPPADRQSRWRFGATHVVLIVGHLSDVKGHPTFLRAAAIVQQRLGNCAFVLLGGETVCKGFGAKLEQLATDLGIRHRVHFLGWREEVPDIVAAADVVALPSLTEGLPLAVLEAMAAGKPVVATPVGGVPDAIDDGETGAIIPLNEPEALAAALVRFLENRELSARVAQAARRRIEERFSLASFLQQIEALYERLAA
jgi:glycosyltransferase involved in cell wall biosynthesis